LDKQISVLQIEISEQRRKYSEAIKKMTIQEINIKNKEIKKTKIKDVSQSVIEIGKGENKKCIIYKFICFL